MRRSYPLALGSPAHGPLQTFDDAYAIALGADTPGGGLVWDFSRAEGAVLRHGTDDGGNSLSDLRLVDDATSEIIRSCISPASAAGGATPTAAGASPRAVAAAAAAAAADD